MERNKHYFYVLKCRDGSYYAGYTNDLHRRIDVHNQGRGAKYTRSRTPVELIYHEIFETRTLAMQAEYKFKQLTRKQKEKWMAKEDT
ncbi:GIY-YIG nuclease family protein [Peribacillus frigoritolerans]|uniref:GIY-YIG nuclease family protein n=1 Tax=Peribacillus frigoritolerans TaxID=450367 RepID=UPI0025A0149D|nr:GIY-YIG nuclease family protein [Peribacillus frigoritolerans]MDM5304051.1 GIY-YIG nuclease family protein [Peribacillus frigoritolerans]